MTAQQRERKKEKKDSVKTKNTNCTVRKIKALQKAKNSVRQQRGTGEKIKVARQRAYTKRQHKVGSVSTDKIFASPA